MIVDIKTALDRYLTHSLTRTLDRQSFDFFCCYAGRSDSTLRAKKRCRVEPDRVRGDAHGAPKGRHPVNPLKVKIYK